MDAPLEPTDDAPPPPRTVPADLVSRLLGSTALGVAALTLIELAGTIAVGLAVETERLSFLHRQGYAFLTQLEKSPASLALVVAAVLGAFTLLRPSTDARGDRLATVALWAVVVGAVIVSLGAVFAVLARFRVAELAPTQDIDSITRRVLFTFVVRNFGAAMLALLVAFGALFRPRPTPVVVD